MKSEKIQQFLENLPHLPGVYKYFNKAGKLIYVGKAKDLRKRVTSYFTKEPENRKTFNLIENIDYLEFTIVNTEQDALLLENSLIKHFQPRYNINLKDDKTYPYIVIKNESFPRVFLTRNVIQDGSEYFGPYTSVVKIRELLELIRSLVPLRKNHTELFIRLTEKGKLKVSPEYYMKGVMEHEEKILTKEDYDVGLHKVRDIIKGKFASLIKPLRNQMKDCIRKMEFEKAEVLQQKLEFIQEYRASSMVVNTKVENLDVFTIRVNDDQAFVNYLLVRKGSIVKTKTVNFSRNPDESEEDIMTSAISQLQKEFKSNVQELVVPFSIKHPDPKLTISIPKKGIKKKLLNLSKKNLDYFSENPAQHSGIEIKKK
jgi:excinuclease ABC subunit C